MKKIASLVAVAAFALTLAGCAVTTDAKTGPGQVTAKYVTTPEGEVLCVFWVPVDGAGIATPEGAQIDCDWTKEPGE